MAISTLLLLLSLSVVLIISFADNISIDCGITGSYVDDNNVTWVGDQGFVTAGETAKIPATTTDSVSKALTTLRYFPTGQSSCYSNIPVTKSEKILVRTTFYYKNYDGEFSPPTFDVIYDGKHRDKVTTSLISEYSFSEVIFVPNNGNISVCLVRTTTADNPFISSIEVVSLDADMYGDLGTDEGFILLQRFAYGAKGLISYPSDPYNRLWIAPLANFLITELSTSAPSIDTSAATNKPPEMVMETAWSADDLTLADDNLPPIGTSVYLAMYFSETQSLGQTQKRSFNIYVGEKQVSSRPVVPMLGKATEVVVRDEVLSSTSQVVFQSTDDSTLPPLINALELYSISNSRDGSQTGGGTAPTQGSDGTNRGSKAGGNSVIGGGASNGKKKKKNNIGVILGVTLGSIFALFSALIALFFAKKRPTPKPQLTVPSTFAGTGGGSGASPLVGQGMGNNMNHQTNDLEVNDINDLIGVNDSYVVQDGLYQPH